MATITGLTASRMLAIEAATVTGGSINGSGNLILLKHDGSTVDAGHVQDAITYATAAASGVIELADNAETIAGTDAVRAVTPASLAAKDATKVLAVANFNNGTPYTSYPVGESYMAFTTSEATTAGWTFGSKAGVIRTYSRGTGGATQLYIRTHASTTTPEMWFRGGDSSGWGTWQKVATIADLDPTAFNQATAFTSYPQGQSRLYYTSPSSTGWDFSGKAGEVMTYRDGTDFARQTWTRHFGGSANITETWVRTANAASGWSGWLVVAEDTGWVSMSMTGGASFTVQRPLYYRRRNGVVYFKGALTVPTGGYTAFANVPVGFRPDTDRLMAVSSNTGTVMSGVVNATGNLNSWTNASTTAWFSIEGWSYPIG